MKPLLSPHVESSIAINLALATAVFSSNLNRMDAASASPIYHA